MECGDFMIVARFGDGRGDNRGTHAYEEVLGMFRAARTLYDEKGPSDDGPFSRAKQFVSYGLLGRGYPIGFACFLFE
jgi:hypothetical protein